jgi:hypothetical protein
MFAIRAFVVKAIAELRAMDQMVSQYKARIHSKRILYGICGLV